ncbi:oligosaccharide flippase family protein [Microbacterium lacusdiani]
MSRSLASAGARGGVFSLAGQAATLLVKLTTIVVLARLIAPEEFGVAAIATTIATYVMSLMPLGLTLAVVQAPQVSQAARSTLFLVNVALGVLGAAAVLALSFVLPQVYGLPELHPLLAWLALGPLFASLSCQSQAQLLRDFQFARIIAAEILSQVLALAVTIAVAAAGHGTAALAVQVLLQIGLQSAMIVVLARWRPGRPARWRGEVAALVNEGVRIFGMNALASGSHAAIVPALGVVTAPAPLGQFDRAQQIIFMPVTLAVDQLQRIAVPVLSRLRDSPERFAAYSSRAQLLLAYPSAALFLVVSALAPQLVAVALGPGWELAGEIVRILAIGAVFRTAAQSTRWGLIASGRSKEGLVMTAWVQVAVLLVTLAGLPGGVIGVAIGNTVAWALAWPVSVVLSARAIGIPWAPQVVVTLRGVAVSGAAAASAWATTLMALPDIITLLVGAAAAVVTIAVAAVIPAVKRDFAALADTVRRAR